MANRQTDERQTNRQTNIKQGRWHRPILLGRGKNVVTHVYPCKNCNVARLQSHIGIYYIAMSASVFKRKGKEEYLGLYSAFLAKVVHSKRSGMDHTAFTCKQHHACFSFVSIHQMSPPQQLRPFNCSSLLIYRPGKDERLSCLVGWPIADGLPTYVVIHQLHVKRRTAKARRPKTDVLPLDHAIKQLRPI